MSISNTFYYQLGGALDNICVAIWPVSGCVHVPIPLRYEQIFSVRQSVNIESIEKRLESHDKSTCIGTMKILYLGTVHELIFLKCLGIYRALA